MEKMVLGIVSPCYNEHEVLQESAVRLTELFDDLIEKGKISSESFVLFVNDGSTDNTWEIIQKLYASNSYVYGINLAGNVGHQNAIHAGMMTAKEWCDAVITMDADLQDDLGAVEKMVDCYKNGFDIVYGVKELRTADPFFKRITALAFYKMQHALGVKTVYNHADFRLMSRRALCQLERFKERNLFLRGIVPMVGYNTTTVRDVISERTAGTSKYTLSKMLNLAVDGITSFSTKPIRLITMLGICFLLLSLIMAIYVLRALIVHVAVPGWPSLMMSMWFIGSIILIAIGIIGEYIGKIYMEVKERPRYNIETVLTRKNNPSQS